MDKEDWVQYKVQTVSCLPKKVGTTEATVHGCVYLLAMVWNGTTSVTSATIVINIYCASKNLISVHTLCREGFKLLRHSHVIAAIAELNDRWIWMQQTRRSKAQR